jgi:hypothetical protein
VRGHDLAGDVEPEADAPEVGGGDRAREPVEDALPLSGIDSDAVIGDHQPGRLAFAPHGDLDRATPSELERVRQKVRDDLLDAQAVPAPTHRLGRIELHLAPGPLESDFEVAEDVLHRLDEIHVGGFEPEFAGLDARDIEQIVHLTRQALALPGDAVERLDHPLRPDRPAAQFFVEPLDGQHERSKRRPQLVRGDRDELLAQTDRLARLAVK